MVVHNHTSDTVACFSCADLISASGMGPNVEVVTDSHFYYFLAAPKGWPDQQSLKAYFEETLGLKINDYGNYRESDEEILSAVLDAGWIKYVDDENMVTTAKYIAKLAEDFGLEFTIIEY